MTEAPRAALTLLIVGAYILLGWGFILLGNTVPVERWALVAITRTGEAYVVGSGGSCAAAWIGAKIPDDWRELRCERMQLINQMTGHNDA